MANPIIHGGQGSPLSIYQDTTEKYHPIGTRAYLQDGRVFYFSRCTGTAIIAGDLLQAEIPTTPADITDQAVDTIAKGEVDVTGYTQGSTDSLDANEYADGYLVVNDATGEGISYKIAGHDAIAASATGTIRLVDPIAVGFEAATTVTLQKNPWADVVISATAQAQVNVGVSNTATSTGTVAAPRYFWTQTWGVAAVRNGSTHAVGDALMSDTTTAGETLIATAGNQVIGLAMGVGANSETRPVFLQIAP